ncbi:MAG: DinB family protein [bacterium]
MEITGTIIERSKAIQFTRRYLLACLEQITDEALDFRLMPPNGQLMYSIREHLLHLADEGELLVHLSILRQEMPADAWRVRHNADGSWTVTGDWPDRASVRAELEKSYAFQDEHLFSRPATEIAAVIDDKHPFLVWEMIDWMIAHESQHRGQVMTLIRMAGFEPPKWQ